MLHTVYYNGPQERTPLLIAHGLFGSARNWNVIAKRLSEHRCVRVVDMRNHAHSPHMQTHRYEDLAEDLATSIETPHHVLGHSMGGKAAMMLALTRPELVDKLVVADIAPVPYQHSQNKPIEAMRNVDLSRIENRAQARAQMQGLPAGLPDFLLQSLDLGGKKWMLNLDVLEREMPKIIGFPNMQSSFEGDALFIRGATSKYIREEHHEEIYRLFPQTQLHTIEDAGHWLHAEQPRVFEQQVTAFL